MVVGVVLSIVRGKNRLFANPCFSISLVLIVMAQNQIRTPNGLGKAK